MTLFGPDGSKWQGTINPTKEDLEQVDYLFWRCGIGLEADLSYKKFEALALENNVPFSAYFFPLPVGTYSPVGQAELVAEQVDPRVPIMLDWEKSKTFNVEVSWDDERIVAGKIRELGFRVATIYTYPGYWSSHGRPYLTEIGCPGFTNSTVQADLKGSPVGIYNLMGGDEGKGWVKYGGMEPTFWQFTWSGEWCNVMMDWNAYKGPKEHLERFFFFEQEVDVTNPKFPQGYDLTGVQYDYTEPGSRQTIKDQLERPTVKGLDREIQRRFVGLQLDLFEHEGVLLGPGTGMRLSNPEIAAGTSWHQPIPWNSTFRGNARAIDTVGLPSHDAAWTAMQKGYLNKYGFASFQQGTNQFNYTGIAAKVKNDPPHIQAYEDPYSRPADSLIKPLKHWSIERRYDLDFLDLNDPLPPINVEPPAQGDKLVARLINDETTGAYYVVGSGGVFGCPNFAIRDYLYGNGIIENKEPDPWSHEDIVGLLMTEDQEVVARLDSIDEDLRAIKSKLGL